MSGKLEATDAIQQQGTTLLMQYGKWILWTNQRNVQNKLQTSSRRRGQLSVGMGTCALTCQNTAHMDWEEHHCIDRDQSTTASYTASWVTVSTHFDAPHTNCLSCNHSSCIVCPAVSSGLLSSADDEPSDASIAGRQQSNHWARWVAIAVWTSHWLVTATREGR